MAIMDDLKIFVLEDIKTEFGFVVYSEPEFAELCARVYNWATDSNQFKVLGRDGEYYLSKTN